MQTHNNFTFIDLFSGIGGFHLALSQLGGKCVFSSEIDKHAIETYKINFGLNSEINIKDVDELQVPDHDVLCAGFPCQAFSKAGKQLGFEDETKGTLFFDIERILLAKKPKYIILENVRNLVSHDKGNTWKTIRSHLTSAGYRLTKQPLILSPHHFGIPQLRERVVILGKYDPQNITVPLKVKFDDLKSKDECTIYSITEHNQESKYEISSYEERILNAWDEFYRNINIEVIGFPIWADVFTEKPDSILPKWKKEIIEKNNKLYSENKPFIDFWLESNNYLKDWTPTQRKFEWQCGNNATSIWDAVIQIRPSGIRVKSPTCFPALVAMVQIPIVGKFKRRLTLKEVARLQSFPDTFIPNSNEQQAYKQFGNAVNVEVIKNCAARLFLE